MVLLFRVGFVVVVNGAIPFAMFSVERCLCITGGVFFGEMNLLVV